MTHPRRANIYASPTWGFALKIYMYTYSLCWEDCIAACSINCSQFHNSCIVWKMISGSVLDLPTSSHSALTKPSCRKQKYQLICQVLVAPRVNFTTAVKFFQFIFPSFNNPYLNHFFIFFYFYFIIVISWLSLAVPSRPARYKNNADSHPLHPPIFLPEGAPPEPGEAGAVRGISGSHGWPLRLPPLRRAQGRPGPPASGCGPPGERGSPRGSGRACP